MSCTTAPSPLNSEILFKAAEEQARAIFKSDIYKNSIVEFPYGEKTYRIRLIRDPSVAGGVSMSSSGIKAPFVIAPEDPTIPDELMNRVKVLSEATSGIFTSYGFINGKRGFHFLSTLEEKLIDAEKKIAETFASSSKIEDLVEFPHEGIIYHLKLVHVPANPQIEGESGMEQCSIINQERQNPPKSLREALIKLVKTTAPVFVGFEQPTQ